MKVQDTFLGSNHLPGNYSSDFSALDPATECAALFNVPDVPILFLDLIEGHSSQAILQMQEDWMVPNNPQLESNNDFAIASGMLGQQQITHQQQSPPQPHQITHQQHQSPPQQHQITHQQHQSPPQQHQITHQQHQITHQQHQNPPQQHQITHQQHQITHQQHQIPPQQHQITHQQQQSPPQQHQLPPQQQQSPYQLQQTAPQHHLNSPQQQQIPPQYHRGPDQQQQIAYPQQQNQPQVQHNQIPRQQQQNQPQQQQVPYQCKQYPPRQQLIIREPYQTPRRPQLIIREQQQSPHQHQQIPHQEQRAPIPQQQNPPHQQRSTHQQLVSNAVLTRLMTLMYHRTNGPRDNDHWRSFTKHFFSPDIKKRACFGKYTHNHPDFEKLASFDCGLCGTGKGFEETYGVMPMMNQMYFGSCGVINEYLHLDLPRVGRRPDNSFVLYCEKAVQETVYDHFRVFHHGKIFLTFDPDLKVKSMELCVEHHEVYFSQRLFGPLVNELIKDATGCETNNDANEDDGVKEQNLLSKLNKVANSGRNVKEFMDKVESQINVFGYSRFYVHSLLQMSGAPNSMNGVMDVSRINNIRPTDTDPSTSVQNTQQGYVDPNDDETSMMVNAVLADMVGEDKPKRGRGKNKGQSSQEWKQKKARVRHNRAKNEASKGGTPGPDSNPRKLSSESIVEDN